MEMMDFAAGGEGRPNAGTKRKPSDSNLGDSDRFFKRFNLLSLSAAQKEHANSNLYIPVAKPPATHETATHPTNPHTAIHSKDELMQVDDTRDRVYIHDLDEELADIESEEEKLIFLPDIEKRLSKLPIQLFTGREEFSNEGQELVLYSIPRSLTVDEERDCVRKAIIEARQRAREKAADEARQVDMNCKYDQSDLIHGTETAHGYGGGYEAEQEEDPDAMDMD